MSCSQKRDIKKSQRKKLRGMILRKNRMNPNLNGVSKWLECSKFIRICDLLIITTSVIIITLTIIIIIQSD